MPNTSRLGEGRKEGWREGGGEGVRGRERKKESCRDRVVSESVKGGYAEPT